MAHIAVPSMLRLPSQWQTTIAERMELNEVSFSPHFWQTQVATSHLECQLRIYSLQAWTTPSVASNNKLFLQVGPKMARTFEQKINLQLKLKAIGADWRFQKFGVLETPYRSKRLWYHYCPLEASYRILTQPGSSSIQDNSNSRGRVGWWQQWVGTGLSGPRTGRHSAVLVAPEKKGETGLNQSKSIREYIHCS